MATDTARIASWVQPQQFLLDIDVRNRQHALEVLATSVGRIYTINPSPVFRALHRRELSGTTALGGGIAIPHARIFGIERPVTICMRTKAGVAFDAPDGKAVSTVLGILVPDAGANEDHRQMLALVASLFNDADFRAQLERASDPEQAGAAFKKAIARLS